MKILFLNPGAEMGGAETSLTDLLAALRKMHPDWQLRLLTGGTGPLLNEVQTLGVQMDTLALPADLAAAGDSGLQAGQGLFEKLQALGRGALAMRGYGQQLKRRVEAWQPTLVHATGFKMQVLAALYLRGGERRVIWHIHDYVSWRPVVRRLLRALAKRCHGALANSDSVAADLRKSCPDLRSIRRIYNAVDIASLDQQPIHDLDAASGSSAPSDDTVRIGLVATYARWKGHEVFLDALAKLPRSLPWRAYIVGGAIYKTAGSQYSADELREAIRRRNLQDYVLITGFLQGRGGIMRALDIVVHASTKPEPFGMVVVEAMGCGKAVVVSKAGGASELFQEGETALGHAPGDSASLSAAIHRLLVEPELRQRLGNNGRSYVERNFSRQHLAEQLTEFYSQMLTSQT